MAKKTFLAVDMGASSGRHLLGHFDGQRLELEEIHRFVNGPIPMNNNFYWNLTGLWSEVLTGLRKASGVCGDSLQSVGVDTWGVDFGLLSKKGELLGNPYCYRDPRTDGAMERAFQIVARNEIFAQTGLQFMQFNSLFQLLVMKEANSPILDHADRFLMMPDLFHWLLSGVPANEFTNATTTQCYNPQTGDWAWDLIGQLNIPTNIFKPTSAPGSVIGSLQNSVRKETGLGQVNVVLPGTHDTASAVMAVPSTSPIGQADWAYVSLGTWALMGIESPVPVVNSIVEKYNFTNEGGVANTTRILKNICGLWLIQQCRENWIKSGKTDSDGSTLSWETLNKWTAEAQPCQSFIDPDHRDFLSPTDMPNAIRDFTNRTGQKVPQSEGQILRTALDSIAMKFRQVIEICEKISGKSIKTIHIVGGGTKNKLLCQAAADATGRLVVTGPVEATAIGNIMMQAIASGDVAGILEARQIIRNSFDVLEYEPKETKQWDDAYARYRQIIQ